MDVQITTKPASAHATYHYWSTHTRWVLYGKFFSYPTNDWLARKLTHHTHTLKFLYLLMTSMNPARVKAYPLQSGSQKEREEKIWSETSWKVSIGSLSMWHWEFLIFFYPEARQEVKGQSMWEDLRQGEVSGRYAGRCRGVGAHQAQRGECRRHAIACRGAGWYGVIV